MWEKALETNTPATKALVSGLIEGNEYLFRVLAVNKAGPSNPSDSSKTFVAKPRFCEYFECFVAKQFIFTATLNYNSSFVL